MLVDVHAHYPMRVIGKVLPDTLLREAQRVRNRPTFVDGLRALVLRVAGTFFSNRSPARRYRVFCHIDKIAKITGGYDNIAIGTDFDGFIKPTMTGFDNMRDLAKLERALEARYKENARLITSENALRVLRRLWS